MDPVQAGLVLVVAAAIAVMFFEMRFLRKRMKNRRVRTAKSGSDLPDEAHNAIITTKAILSSLDRQGLRSNEASASLREAEMAYERRNYRVALDLTGKAKGRLLSLKSTQASQGDLAKLARLPPTGPDGEPTTKERLTKEIPPNMLQSKFAIEVAGGAIEEARTVGRDVAQATELLEAAKGRYEAKAFDAALTIARQSKRSAEGQKLEISSAVPKPSAAPQGPSTRPCPSCGAALQSDDAFCRKCGTRLVASTCASCGVSLLADDVFCRKCGAPVSR